MKKKLALMALLGSIMFISGSESYSANNMTTLPIQGDTLSNLILQKDTVPAVLGAVAYVNRGCNTLQITDSKVLQQPQNNFWREEWTVNACNVKYYVPITFILDPTGATYSINPNTIYHE